ncbi:squalene/phytoene synthase family protein [Blastomonas sp. AAP53]|uniref:squalene/phytoene synthase family protein n=1 Tax=Blastomonas sp. AAP53 TaxID=1248760 RepID=UPI0003072BEA|nr:squalene/phytoene synthase family protein [Blastomonas sp. AAP53]
MDASQTPVSPLVTLATGYGDAQMRLWCQALFAFDAQIAGIVLQAREPMLAQIRLQWWHDVIAKPVASRPSANPVLAALLPLEAQGLDLAGALGGVIRGWEAALDREDSAAVADFAKGRGQLMAAFAPLGQGAARDDLHRIGAAWALWDMVRFHRRTEALDAAVRGIDAQALARIRLPRNLRPLSIIARAVQLDIAQGAMDRPWGSPGVFARLVWHGLSGR